jgi:hypothetical protein
MRAQEFLKESVVQGFHVYGARVKVPNPSYATSIDVAIFAKSPAMARLLLKAQYGEKSVITNVYKIG